ncbi:hypothetical protein AcV5_000467 [Taiwanofungus camphoratus]|nr:hypothetical protein AcV5_000467 [Antrodia cinnamomea]
MLLDPVYLPRYVVQDIIHLQGVEMVRLRKELNEAKRKKDEYKSYLDAHDKLRQLSRDVRTVLETRNQEAETRSHELQLLRDELQAVQSTNKELRVGLDQSRQALAETSTQNEIMSRELSKTRTSLLSLRKELGDSKADLKKMRNQFISELAQADELYHILEAQFHEMEKDMHRAQKESDWTEKELATSCSYIADILSELAEQHVIQNTLQEEVSVAFTRGSNMNKWLLRTTQKDLEDSLSREAILAKELAECQSQLSAAKTEEESLTLQSNLQTGTEKTVGDASSSAARVDSDKDVVYSKSQTSGASGLDPALCAEIHGTAVEDMFTPFATKAPNLEEVRRDLGIRSIFVALPDDLVWVECPNTAYFVKSTQRLGKGNNWKACKNKSVKRLQKGGTTEIILHASGAFYYTGTYVVGDAEKLCLADFEKLPEKVM